MHRILDHRNVIGKLFDDKPLILCGLGKFAPAKLCHYGRFDKAAETLFDQPLVRFSTAIFAAAIFARSAPEAARPRSSYPPARSRSLSTDLR